MKRLAENCDRVQVAWRIPHECYKGGDWTLPRPPAVGVGGDKTAVDERNCPVLWHHALLGYLHSFYHHCEHAMRI